MPDPMKAEKLLAELNRLRGDLDEDPTDIEWITLHHAFVFISYETSAFERYVAEQDAKGVFDQFKQEDQLG